MDNVKVGASIMSIITESLYDNPIVVFREYVQNSVDSIFQTDNPKNREIRIWVDGDNLYFLDNGIGIKPTSFYDEMVKIGASTKEKQKNLGYKGIGRLSGVPYCEELTFVNISNYNNDYNQKYTIRGSLYNDIKNQNEFEKMSFSDLMKKIGQFTDDVRLNAITQDYKGVEENLDMLKSSNSGFLVILKNISYILKNTIEKPDFELNLQWLLPVDFDPSLYNSRYKDLFLELTSNNNAPIKYCSVFYNGNPIYRPIKEQMLRDYVCKCDFNYAVGFHSFNNDKIAIDHKNPFRGIKVYLDNMLLCDEAELLDNLDNYGILAHTSNGQLQSVRGIGALIYITDKVSIAANARRTFIEVTDQDSIDFLNLVAEFINIVYETRYALSDYTSAKKKIGIQQDKLDNLRENATQCLLKLAKEKVEIAQDEDIDFEKLTNTEKKRMIKKRISSELDRKIKEYIKQLDNYSINNSFNDFMTWLNNAE